MRWGPEWFIAHPSLTKSQRLEECVIGTCEYGQSYTGMDQPAWLIATFDNHHFWTWLPIEERFIVIHAKEVAIV